MSFHCITVSPCFPSRGSSYMVLSAVFDMQHTTELQTPDSSLENTFQPASDCITGNDSWRQASIISTTKSRSVSALMWILLIKSLIIRWLCWIILAANVQSTAKMKSVVVQIITLAWWRIQILTNEDLIISKLFFLVPIDQMFSSLKGKLPRFYIIKLMIFWHCRNLYVLFCFV